MSKKEKILEKAKTHLAFFMRRQTTFSFFFDLVAFFTLISVQK